MLENMKKWTAQLMGGANVATILVMLVVGYSDRLNPIDYPFLSTLGLAFPVFLVINCAFLVFWAFFKLRGCILPLVGFIVCYAPVRTYVPFNITKTAPEGAIKVMSYNVFRLHQATECRYSLSSRGQLGRSLSKDNRFAVQFYLRLSGF